MDKKISFDYYYGIEAEQFSFYRVPRLLVKDARFKGLSSDAKLLYGLMLDRMALSMKNGWLDEENRAYIHYTLDSIMEDLGCAKEKCTKVLAELDSKKGIGLIEKKRQGLGKPDIIYVKNFAAFEVEHQPEKEWENPSNADVSTEVRKSNFKKSENRTSRSSEIELQEVRKSNFKKFENRTSRGSETELAEVRKSNASYNNYNYTNQNYTEGNHLIHRINLSEEQTKDTIDEIENTDAYLAMIKEHLAYEQHMEMETYEDRELYDELFQVVCDIVCVKRTTVRIGREDYPYALVKAKFLKLTSSHLEYVIHCMKHTTTKIGSIKAYMLTALYNAPDTMGHYYQQAVQHDMYGGGWEEKGIV